MSTTISVARMSLKRETKGAVLYENTASDLAITNLYLRKSGLQAPYPKFINVNITVAEDVPSD